MPNLMPYVFLLAGAAVLLATTALLADCYCGLRSLYLRVRMHYLRLRYRITYTDGLNLIGLAFLAYIALRVTLI